MYCTHYTGTGTWSHCILLCSSRSLSRFRSRAVCMSHNAIKLSMLAEVHFLDVCPILFVLIHEILFYGMGIAIVMGNVISLFAWYSAFETLVAVDSVFGRTALEIETEQRERRRFRRRWYLRETQCQLFCFSHGTRRLSSRNEINTKINREVTSLIESWQKHQ